MTKAETWAKLIELGAAEGPMPEDENWYLHRVSLHGADLPGADLSGADLSEAGLMRTNLGGANLIGANLFGADLSGAALMGANLSGADLIEATLIEADLSGANLIGADLSEADLLGAKLIAARLSLADLSGTVLRGANMAASTLTRANLSNADLSGVCIDNADLAEWNITGVICTHLVQKKDEARSTITFAPQEFEKRFGRPERTAELTLNIPMTPLAGFVGESIAGSVNHARNLTVMAMKGIEGLPDGCTRFTFTILDGDFYKNRKSTLETVLKDTLNDYFRHNPPDRIPDCRARAVSGVAGERAATRGNVTFLPGAEPDTKAAQRALSYYLEIRNMEKSIYRIVTLLID